MIYYIIRRNILHNYTTIPRLNSLQKVHSSLESCQITKSNCTKLADNKQQL